MEDVDTAQSDQIALNALAAEDTSTARELLAASGVTYLDVPEEGRPAWRLAIETLSAGRPLDLAVMAAELARTGNDRSYIYRAMINPTFGVDTKARLSMVRDTGVRTRTAEALEMAALAVRQGAPMDEVDKRLALATSEVRSSGGGGRVRNCAGSATKQLKALESAWSGETPPLLGTGWPDFDDSIALNPNLISIGSCAGVGKSSLVAGMVRQWVTAGVKVGVLSYEDDSQDLISRLIAQHAGCSIRVACGEIKTSAIMQDKVRDAHEWWGSVEHLLETDDERPVGNIEASVGSIREMVRRGCKVIVLDNLTSLGFEGGTERFDLEVGRALLAFRSEAQAAEIPVIIVGHLKRGQGDTDESTRPPKKSDFADSAAWERYSRVMLGLWREDGNLMMRILKQNRGPSGIDYLVDVSTEAAVVVGCSRLR